MPPPAAHLFWCDEGFFICEVCVEANGGERYLNVWLMWFKPGAGKKRKKALIAQLDALKAALGCLWIAFTSPRLEWCGMIEGDFELVSYNFRRY